MDGSVPSAFAGRSLEELVEWRDFIEKVCFIQTRIHKYGVIKILKGRVRRDAATRCEQFFEIAKTGRLKRTLSFGGEIDLAKTGAHWRKLIAAMKRGESVEFGFDTSDGGPLKILNVSVPLGRIRVRHDARGVAEQVERALVEGKAAVKFSVADVEVTEEYPDWSPPSVPVAGSSS